jgi:hypothetical protein
MDSSFQKQEAIAKRKGLNTCKNISSEIGHFKQTCIIGIKKHSGLSCDMILLEESSRDKHSKTGKVIKLKRLQIYLVLAVYLQG